MGTGLALAGALRFADRWGLAALLVGMGVLVLAGESAFLAGRRRWLLRTAAGLGRSDAGAGGSAGLPSWPGLQESGSLLVIRRGRGPLRPWALAAGLVAAAGAVYALGGPASGLGGAVSAFAAVAMAITISVARGPTGWRLAVDSVRQSAELLRFLPWGRLQALSAGLPTVRAVRLEVRDGDGNSHRIAIELSDGEWALPLPADWPPELPRALAARLTRLTGVGPERPG